MHAAVRAISRIRRPCPWGRMLAPLLLGTVALALGACGESADSRWPDVLTLGEDTTYARVVSNELTVGENRFLFGLLDENDEPITGADVRVRFYNLDVSESEPVTESSARQIHTQGAVPEYEWLYVARVTFPQAGEWGAEFEIRRPDEDVETVRFRFPVREETLVFDIGEPVPATKNLTVEDVDGNIFDRRLTTDPEPDPGLYQMTVAEALNAGKPFVVVFATPGFCQTRTCGPMVDVVKSVSPEFAGRVNFIHVEIADLDATTNRGELVYNPFFYEWTLPSEPWTFVVDAQGRVFAKFEGVLLPDELRQSLREVLGRP